MHCMQYNLHKYCIIIVLCVLDAVKVPYCACRSQHMRTLIGNYHVTALLSTNARTCTLDLEHAGVHIENGTLVRHITSLTCAGILRAVVPANHIPANDGRVRFSSVHPTDGEATRW